MIFYSSSKMTAMTALAGVIATASIAAGQEPVLISANASFPEELPYIGDLIESAFPTWCIDEDEQRINDVDFCEDGSPNGRWSPLYFTKEFSGADPALGGYPSDIDIQYAFYFGSPFLGQACAGGPHHCSEDFDGVNSNCAACPKVKTEEDNGPNGPGHIPPHIALASVTKFYNDMAADQDIDEIEVFATAYDYDTNACRILPASLLRMIREYYPRDPETGEAYFPPPFTEAGGGYPLEFVNLAVESCEREKAKHSEAGAMACFEQHSGDVSLYPDYLDAGHGSPHYCTKEGKEADVYNDWCPYIFFGPNRGKYRHPHVAFAAVESYIANLVMPDKCGTTWDDSNFPPTVDTTQAFPYMEDMTDVNGMAPTQPLISNGNWIWPGPMGRKKKPAKGLFTFDLYVSSGPTGDDYCSIESDKACYALGWPTCCLTKDGIPCPDEKPSCDKDSLPGSSYCTHSPDETCYASGWPACCGDDSVTCPEEKPPCDDKCDSLAKIVCEKSQNLSDLCDLVKKAGLAEPLSDGSWTVFAPQNGAFDGLDVDGWSNDRLKRFLLFHVVANEEIYSSDLKCVSPDNLVTMANGKDSRTLCRSGVPTYQKGKENSDGDLPKIVQADIAACNGVAHVLDEVMLYQDYN